MQICHNITHKQHTHTPYHTLPYLTLPLGSAVLIDWQSIRTAHPKGKVPILCFITCLFPFPFNSADSEDLSLAVLVNSDRFRLLFKLFSRILCCPATSSPVERVSSHSGLITHPHLMRDQLLQTLVFLK